MLRNEFLQSSIKKELLGLEIGPLHNPICPKREGWNILSLDICDAESLRSKYQQDANVDHSQIEEVDIIYRKSLGESILNYCELPESRIAHQSGALDYIISSHNFEHQPNPLGFLSDCESALKDDGELLMAVPIASRCFDCFLPLTTSGKAIDAYLNDQAEPSPGSIFDNVAYHATLDERVCIHDQNYSIDKVVLVNNPGQKFLDLFRCEGREYIDAHVSRFNHYSFELLIRDALAINILNCLVVDEIHLLGSEFLVRLKKDSSLSDGAKKFNSEDRLALTRKSIEFHCKDILKSENKALIAPLFDDQIDCFELS